MTILNFRNTVKYILRGNFVNRWSLNLKLISVQRLSSTFTQHLRWGIWKSSHLKICQQLLNLRPSFTTNTQIFMASWKLKTDNNWKLTWWNICSEWWLHPPKRIKQFLYAVSVAHAFGEGYEPASKNNNNKLLLWFQ